MKTQAECILMLEQLLALTKADKQDKIDILIAKVCRALLAKLRAELNGAKLEGD